MMVVEDVWLELNVLFPAPAHALVQIQDQILQANEKNTEAGDGREEENTIANEKTSLI